MSCINMVFEILHCTALLLQTTVRLDKPCETVRLDKPCEATIWGYCTIGSARLWSPSERKHTE